MVKMRNNDTEQAVPEIYTNSANAIVTPYEILLQLGLETQGNVKPICNIRMSPHFAKALSQMLNNTVMQYESQFGEISSGAVKTGRRKK